MTVALAFMVAAAFCGVVLAGNLDSPGEPSAGSGMYTILDIYNYLNLGTDPSIVDSFQEPSSGPVATMKTTKDIYDDTKTKFDECNATADKVLSGTRFFSTAGGTWGPADGTYPAAPVPKTGQTPTTPLNPAPTGSDGNLQKGVTWPAQRFTDKGNGTVTDNLTGLIWLQHATCFGTRTWANALSDCAALASGACGLSDGSIAGDWRLPNIKELLSLLDYAFAGPPVSNAAGTGKWSAGDAFTNIIFAPGNYWTSSTCAYYSSGLYAWKVDMYHGRTTDENLKTELNYVWPVRGGQ